jgi:hypothetical protein
VRASALRLLGDQHAQIGKAIGDFDYATALSMLEAASQI